MNTAELADTLTALLSELVEGTPETGGFMLNRGDPGLLRSLERLSAAEASAVPAGGGAPLAAHVEHVRYGLSLMNRWAGGENPFRDADWTAAWRIPAVGEDEWARLRSGLADEARRWKDALATPRDVARVELNGIVGSIAHLAYHVGAIRQIDRDARGPGAEESVGSA